MNIRRKAHDTLDTITNASTTVITTTEWATVALIGTTAVAVLALLLAVVALGRTPTART